MRVKLAGLAFTVLGVSGPAFALDIGSLPQGDQRLLQNIFEYERTNVPRELPGSGIAVVIVRTDTLDEVCRTFRYGAGGDIDSGRACRIGNRQWAIDGAAPMLMADVRAEFGESDGLSVIEEADEGEAVTAVAAASVPAAPAAVAPPEVPVPAERPVVVAQSEPIPDAVPEAPAAAAPFVAPEVIQVAAAPFDPPLPLRRPDVAVMLAAAETPAADTVAEAPPPRPRPRGLIDVVPPRTDVTPLPTDRPAGLMLAAIEPTPRLPIEPSLANVAVTATLPQPAFTMEPLVTEILAQPAIVIRSAGDEDLTLVASTERLDLVSVEAGAGDTPVLPSPNRGIWPPQIAWEVPMPSLAGAPTSLDSPLARLPQNAQSAELYIPPPDELGAVPIPQPRP